MALLRRSAAQARDRGRYERCRRPRDAGARPYRWPTPAGDRAGPRLAGGAKSRRLDTGRLHGGAGLRVGGVRARTAGLGAAWRGALTTLALITARVHSH